MKQTDSNSENLTDDEIEIIISEEDKENYKRLDQLLNDKIKGYSRSFIQNLFKKNFIEATNHHKIELKKVPPVGTRVIVQIPPPLPASAKAENIDLDIIYEDEHLIFVNKPAGMVTHPAPGNYSGTLVNALLYHCHDLQGIGDQKRPGIVHRLDKGTSGVMVIAKTQKCHEGLVLLFSEHKINRIYEALCWGNRLPLKGEVTSHIGRSANDRKKMALNVKGGKFSHTYYQVIKYYEDFCHAQCKLETGRTHQIRVHLAQGQHSPLLMDPTYGNPSDQIKKMKNQKIKALLKDYPHPLLHAKTLGLKHPITGKEINFDVEPPPIFKKVLELAKS
ncbi:MAG: RluA family pseudouridine synthase [Bacteriovoracaceae bacterium]